MARDVYRGVNESLYACSLEQLGRRNRLIMIMFAGGLAWAWMFIEPLNVQWFFEESWLTYNALGDEAIESEVHSRGGIWWSLLGTLLVSVGLAPLTISFVLFTYRSKGVTEEWLKNVWTSVTLIPIAAIWALLWLVCLPVTWWLLPWGEWGMNWWKIFPFFGLGLFGGLPLLGVLLNTLDQLRNPKYTFDEGKEVEAEREQEAEAEREEEESSSTASESSDRFTAPGERSANVVEAESNRGPAITALSIGIFLNIIGLPLFIGSEQENLGMLIPGAIAFGVGGAMIVVALFVLLSSWTKSHAKTGKSAPGWIKVIPVFGIFLMIPGVVFLILGGVAAENFEHYGVSTATLEIEDVDMLGDQGFIIFVKGTPGDKNGNGMHDYCEDIIVNATHSGAWMSDPWKGEISNYHEADETRQVFELEISHEGSGCDAQHWPKEKWKNDTQLVKIGRACYGCMAGNTTITAEYDTSALDLTYPPMWIQDGEALVESTLTTILGAILTGIGALMVIGSIVTVVSLKEARRKELEEEKEPIEIIGQAAPNQPVRFRINKTRLGRDAWVGIYPVSADDQDHGGRWSWLRDIDANDATLPGQPAGKWSIRVFKDGGYILKHRLDFEIHGASQQPSTPTSSEGIVEAKVAFKSVHGKYLSAQPDGRAEWNRDIASDWEYFHLEERQGGKITLKGAHDMYVSAQPDGSVQINRGAAPEGGWEEFTVEIRPNIVCLKSCHGKYLSAQQDGTAQWNRDHAPRGGWEEFQIEHTGNTPARQQESIEILQAVVGKPVRFKINNRPNGAEAWFGLYSEQANDHAHGEHQQKWMYFREVGQNEISLPAQSAGRWSIRVFSDGGFNQIGRLDFEITDNRSSDSAKRIQSALKAEQRESATRTTPMPSYVIVAQAGSSEVNGNYEYMPGKHQNRHWGTIAGHYQHTQNPEIFIAFQDCGTNHQRPEWNKWMIISKIGVLYAAHTGGKIGVPPREGVWETVESWGNPGAPGGKHPAPTLYHPPAAATQIQEHGSSESGSTNFWDTVG